ADGPTGEVTPSPAFWNGRLYPVHSASRLFCYKIAADPELKWGYTGTLCDVSSPVALNGLLFMAKGSGEMACVDAETGNELWTHDCPGCYASLLASGDRVYLPGRDGSMLIV